MDGWTDGWMDGWMDGRTDGRTDRQIQINEGKFPLGKLSSLHRRKEMLVANILRARPKWVVNLTGTGYFTAAGKVPPEPN
jgi:hypothetical protein